MRIRLQRVQYMPKVLEPGVLYVAEAFDAAAHLCACGCGAKIRTPLGPTEWSFEETQYGPTVRPSIGNWQLPCQSHYWICEGEIRWAAKWAPEEIEAGRRAEDARRRAYYEALDRQHGGLWHRFWSWLKELFKS